LQSVTEHLRWKRRRLDNCQHLREASVQVVAHLLQECGKVRILATSREPLGIVGETVWSVPALTAPVMEHLPPGHRTGGGARPSDDHGTDRLMPGSPSGSVNRWQSQGSMTSADVVGDTGLVLCPLERREAVAALRPKLNSKRAWLTRPLTALLQCELDRLLE
jgi:hypothetical protein